MKKYFKYSSMILFFALIFTSCEKAFTYDKNEIPSDFIGLEVPDEGEGFQIHVPAFPIPADFEREWFMRLPIGNTEEIFVSEFESKCRPGTHHLIAYGFEDENENDLPEIGIMRDQNRPDGRANIRTAMGGDLAYFISQEADFTIKFPEGMAVRIPANSTVDLNSHYFNRTDKTLFGEVFLNAYTKPKNEVTEILEISQVDNSDQLILPPGETTIITHTRLFQEKQNLRMLVSHMHKRGILFEAFKVGGVNDGEKLYSAWDYKHPPTLFFEDEPLIIEAGEGIRTEVTYENTSNRTIRYGVTSEDEMGILFYMFSNEQ